MATEGEEEDKESKTEDPSQKKLADALEKGQVVNSKEVTSFLVFLSITILAIWVMPYSSLLIAAKLKPLIELSWQITPEQDQLTIIFADLIYKILTYLSPIFCAIIISSVFSSYMQHGNFVFTGETIKPSLSKLSLIKGFGRLFSKKSLMEFIKSLFKIIIVGSFVYLLVMQDIKELSQYQELSIHDITEQIKQIIYHILILVTLIMAAIAAIDFSFQKYEHIENLKMTKQEVKEEYKQLEGNPEIKQKIRELRRGNLQKILKQTVPKATVIITNPEHYAIALQYDSSTHEAPICVAKGMDIIAQKIKEIAKEHKVPIVESPPLARALYKDVTIDQQIPEEYFESVARILSYVMKLEEKKKAEKL